MGFSDYNYADESYIGAMTAQDLEDIFNNIISSITSITGGATTGETVGGRDKVTYYDTLGEGVRFTGTMTLRVPRFDQTENGGLTQGETDEYQLTAYAAVAAGGINAGTQMNMENAPAYLAAGGRIEFRPSSEYQKALEGLNVSVTMLSSGKRQLQVDIPPSLMAYNIINTNTTEGGTTYDYYEAKEPLRLTYSVQMREDVNNAGSYLIGAPAETYVEFYPSSAQDAEGHYEMPYYWPGGQFNNDDTQNKGQTGDQVDKVAGSSDYVYSATKGNNNNVRIYLGNNGLYTLTGKTMNLTVNWADESNADGLRPSSVTLQLYVDKGDSNIVAVEDSQVALPAANGVDDATYNDTLKYTFEGLQVYFPEGNRSVAKYYVAFLGEDGQPLTFEEASQNAPYSEYKYRIDNTSTGAGQQGNYFLFDGYRDLQTALEGNLELTLSHQKATIDYTVKKEWDGGQGTSATMQLLADGVLADESLLGEQEGTVTLNGSEETPWSHTWENLPKYKDGHEIVYRAAETAYEGTAGVYFQTSYDFTTPNTTTVTNTAQNAEQAKMNFTARVFWNDAENQDGVRPKTVRLKLVAKANEVDVSSDAVFGSFSEWRKDVGVDDTWTVVWEGLPRFTTEGEQITYSIVEMNDEAELQVGGALDANYNVSNYNAVGDGYMTVTNTHTPATVAITINKEWSDNSNQDGLRPEKIEGILYTRSGDSYTPVRTWSIENNTTESAHTTTISGLPANANGTAIQYYVSEHAVPEYDTSAGSQETGPYFEVGADNTITLTNTHTVSTVTYKVDLTWDDNNNTAGKRPDTVTVKLSGEYYVTLTVSAGNTGITEVASSNLPNGAQASWSDNTLTISGLPQFVNGVQQTYQGFVSDIGEYSETITGFTTESVSYTLSYAGSTTYDSLGFTKTWVDYTNNGYDMRPSTTEYAQYLTLQSKVGDAQWSAVADAPDPRITVSGANYTVTYSGLPMYGEGGAIQYQVVESAVPNFETEVNAVALKESGYDTLTNTFKLTTDPDGGNTYGEITVTKVWDDADNTSQRPGYANDSDPLNIKLYRATDGTHANGIAPSSITVNGDNTWTYKWAAGTVLKTDKDGTSIDYVAYEGTVPAGYITTDQSVAVTEDGTVKSDVKITNTYSGSAATGTLTITKSWQGDGQYTDKRPNSLSFTVTGKVAGGTNNISRTVTMSNDWADVVVADLPLTINGQKVTYTVTEINIPDGYSAEYSGEVVLADVQGNAATITVTNTYTPDTWTLTYHANGGTGAPTDDTKYSKTNATATVKGQGDMTYGSNIFLGWTTEIHGVVVDANDVPAPLYKTDDTLTMTGDATLYAVWAVDSNGDNTPDYQQKIITVNVVWQDDGNRCGIRPNMIEFKLNGEKCTVDLENSTDVRVTTNDGNTRWIYEIVVDADAAISEGSITAVNVTPKDHADQNDTTGYTSSVAYADDVFTITLTHTPETTSHSVKKDWDFGNATFTTGKATIQLFANGQPALDSNNQPLTQTFVPEGSEPLGWNDLPKYEGGQLITYQAIETQVVDTSGNDVTAHFRAEYDTSTPGMTKITNTYTELRNITLHYFWDDNNNAAGERPTEVTVQLFYTISDDATIRAAGVQPVENSEKTISADSEGNWNVTWTALPIYDVDGSGKVLNYEAHVVAYTDAEGTEHNNLNLGENNDELTGSNYTFDVVSFGMDSVFIMNSAMDTTTDFKVTKQWNDANNAYSTRPDTIWVNLMQDGVIYQSAEVKADASGNWTHTWADLPVYPTGSNDAYDYTVSEIPVPGYTSTVAGNTITNALDALSNPDDPDNQLTVTFVYNNGQQNTTQTVSFGGTATSITPTWDGHVFKGWYTDNDTFVNPYDFTDPVTDNITLYAKWVSIHDGTEDKDDHHFVTFVYENASATNNGTAIAENTKIQVACGSDYTFTAAADSGYILNTPTKVGSATLVANGNNSFTLDNITSDITVTITATRQTTGGSTGGGGGGGTTRPELEKGDHFAYIVGYEDGTVRPENNITRAEVATIFFRLLTEESREAYYSEVNAFTDVSDGDWYNNAISTLVNADIITGYTDGSFRPDAYITRAELAATASRFDDISGGETRLTDIDGHWAEELISSAYNKGWVDGYPDGSFRPDQNITRAEVMTLVNRVLERAVDQDGMLDDMVTWSDNQPSSWYYEAVQEATNSHDYSRDEGETLETWTEITPPRDWTELEK
ncbi:Cna B-type domain-containing protein [Agathobaculum sp.]|uniref:Cna B-type domain-containing protein n=1 Tax=Agathobaculum sp. TaxID=2048138 RepID=UPI0039A0A1FB